jgi:hypothetical protein
LPPNLIALWLWLQPLAPEDEYSAFGLRAAEFGRDLSGAAIDFYSIELVSAQRVEIESLLPPHLAASADLNAVEHDLEEAVVPYERPLTATRIIRLREQLIGGRSSLQMGGARMVRPGIARRTSPR